jgi:hypothetical protein
MQNGRVMTPRGRSFAVPGAAQGVAYGVGEVLAVAVGVVFVLAFGVEVVVGDAVVGAGVGGGEYVE